MLLNAESPGALAIILYLVIVLAVAIPVIRAIVKLYKLCVRALKKYVEDGKERVD